MFIICHLLYNLRTSGLGHVNLNVHSANLALGRVLAISLYPTSQSGSASRSVSTVRIVTATTGRITSADCIRAHSPVPPTLVPLRDQRAGAALKVMANILMPNLLYEEKPPTPTQKSPLMNGGHGMNGQNVTNYVAVDLEIECVFAKARIVLDRISKRKNATYILV